MAAISSDDCKAFLELHFHHSAKEWKRLSKKKDATGRVVREFSHPLFGTVLLAEVPNGLVNLTTSGVAASRAVASLQTAMAAPAPRTQPATGQLGTWDIVRKEFNQADLVGAQFLFDNAANHRSVTLNTSGAGYHAMPGLFSFCFMDEAGDQYNVVQDINKSKDPNAIVAGLTVFITARHRDYGCNHLSWAVKPFLPGYFEEVEESTFALYAKWVRVYDEERQDAVDNGTIAQVRLMDVMRELSSRGFYYDPNNCVFSKLMALGNTYTA